MYTDDVDVDGDDDDDNNDYEEDNGTDIVKRSTLLSSISSLAFTIPAPRHFVINLAQLTYPLQDTSCLADDVNLETVAIGEKMNSDTYRPRFRAKCVCALGRIYIFTTIYGTYPINMSLGMLFHTSNSI